MRTVSLAKYRKGFVAFTVYGVDTEEPAPGEAGTPPPGSARLGTQRNLHRLGSGHPVHDRQAGSGASGTQSQAGS